MFSSKFIGYLVILQMLSHMAQTIDFPTDCDVFYNNSCFSYTGPPYKGWSDANTDCITRGGYLTSINSENENDMLADLEVKVTGATGGNAWIGLDYNRYMQSNNWVDGTPITYSRTVDTAGTSPLCIVITGAGSWRAFSCSGARSYICRRPGGSAFAIKLDNGQYEYIAGSDTTIDTIPTTLVCRTDTYLSTQITWEYKPMQNDQWTDKQGSWNETTGISELTISYYGYYRCHVKIGGSDEIYTATAMDPTTTTTITTATTTTTQTTPVTTTASTNKQTTEPQAPTTTETFTTPKPENNTDPPSSPNCQALNGVVITLIVFLIGLVVLLVCIIIFLLVCLRKRKPNNYQFKHIPDKDEKPAYETIAQSEQKETKSNQYNKQRITTATGSSDYIQLSEVTNKKFAVEPPESNYYTPMVGVENRDINLTI